MSGTYLSSNFCYHYCQIGSQLAYQNSRSKILLSAFAEPIAGLLWQSRFRNFSASDRMPNLSYSLKFCIMCHFRRILGRSRGFGFVYYDTLEEARRAKTSCEGGLDIDGKIARVDYSLTTAPHDPTPGVYLGKRHNTVDRRRERPYDRSHRSSRYPEDDGDSYGRVSSRYSGRTASPRGVRDRSPARSRFPQRNRRRTISSSRSPQPYNGTRNIPNRSPQRSRKQEIGNGVGVTKPMGEVWSGAE